MSRKSRRRFWARLRDLGFTSYTDYLKSSHWSAVKDEFWSINRNRRCFICSGVASQIHHVTYARLGEEQMRDLRPACQSCHAAVHEHERTLPVGSTRLDRVTIEARREIRRSMSMGGRVVRSRKARAKELAALISSQKRDLGY